MEHIEHNTVPECCKDDYKSQWENGKFDPHHAKMAEPIIPQLCMGNCVTEAHPMQNFTIIIIIIINE